MTHNEMIQALLEIAKHVESVDRQSLYTVMDSLHAAREKEIMRSWAGQVDRMGGAYDDSEKARYYEDRW